MRRGLIFLTLAAFMMAGVASASSVKVPIKNLPVRGGSSDPVISVSSVDLPPLDRGSLDSVGVGYVAGTTWYDQQHNGTAGKMIGVDGDGYVHIVWMNGLESDQDPRHVFYNVWDPSTEEFTYPSGIQINASQNGGYICQVTQGDGFCFPAFHEIVSPPNAHSAAAIDFMPRSGYYTTSQPIPVGGLEIIWPKVAQDIDNYLHVVSTENPASGEAGDPQKIYYSRGLPVYDNDGFGLDIDWEGVSGAREMLEIDTVMVIAADIACSRVSNRMAIVWSKSQDDLLDDPSQYNNDLYMMVSEDGGMNWGNEINITEFEQPDYDCASGDTAECNKDTFRVYTDMSVIFDWDDNIHIAFTTSFLWSLEGIINVAESDVWHWDETFLEFSPIAHGEFGDSTYWSLPDSPGAWQRMVQRPSLCVDGVTGYLYCSYQWYDPMQATESGWPQGDAMLSVSCTCGRTWSQAVNVSDTWGGNVAPTGESKSERDITISDHVTYENEIGYVHMEYIFDHDGGTIPQEEGVATLNEVIYRRIPVSDVPLTPVQDPYYPVLRIDSTGMPGWIYNMPEEGECVPCGIVNTDWNQGSDFVPEAFHLYQNYPNPFNPSTTIQFDMIRSAKVTLKVFNVLGQEVAVVYDNEPLLAGVHKTTFDATDLTSGVYIYRLETENFSDSRKMILMK
jgi:hypothetical protein